MLDKSVVRKLLAVLLIDLLVVPPLQQMQPLYGVAEAQEAPAWSAPPPAEETETSSSPMPAAEATEAASNGFTVEVVDPTALSVSVGFADSATASSDFPTPWLGAPNVIYLGGGAPVNAGAIRLDNTTSAPLSIDRVTVDLQRSNAKFSLWGAFAIPAGGSAILTQTLPGNFDTNAFPIVACGGTLPAGETRIPKITVAMGGGEVTYVDTAHVLDTGGFDSSCRGNESLQWRAIGTRGIEAPGGQLTLGPANVVGAGGSSITLTAQLRDANGDALRNVFVDFKVTSGPNNGQTGQNVTDSRGEARFTYIGTAQGGDVVRASVTNASAATLLSNDVTVSWNTASCGPDIPLPPSGVATLLYIGGTRAQFSDPIELAALLSAPSGAPVAGRLLTFSFGGLTLTATTDATGVARVATLVNIAPAEVPVSVDFAGDASLPPLRATQTVTVEREDVLLEYTAKTLLGTVVPQTVTARLRDPDSLAPIAGKVITFTVGAVSATATTDANGIASTTITLGSNQVSGPNSLTVSFAGDVFYEPAFRTVAVIIHLSTSFVIWGGNAGGLKLGQRVNFWGAQWEDQVTGGDYIVKESGKPSQSGAFKGLADPLANGGAIHLCQTTATGRTLNPGCWISKGGQTFPPPISVPAYIQVIVATVIVKKGADISGNIAATAVMKVDPEPKYGPDPGKPGFGVIVAVIEDSTVFPKPAAIAASQSQPQTVLPNQQFTITTTIINSSTATAATNVQLNETLDGVTPSSVSRSIGAIAAGGIQTVSFLATTPAIEIRRSTETAADYIRRLSSLNGRVFTSSGQVTFSDSNAQLYQPVDVASQSVLTIPVLTLALSGPAVVSPGTPAPYKITVTNVGSAPATATVALTMPDGSTRSISISNLVAGSSFTHIETFTPTAIAPKGASETTDQYLARLREADGQLLTTKAAVTWRDADGNSYGEVGDQIFSSRIRVPVLEFTTESPSVLLSTQTATLRFNVRNSGGCTAVLSNLEVTNPDGTKTKAPQFVLAGGASTTIETTWRVPELPKRDEDNETDAQYLARLVAANNSNLDFQISLDWSDPAGSTYGPTSGSARSKQILSIVPITLTAPATAEAGTTITYVVAGSNIGAATAPQIDLTVFLPSGSFQKPAVGSLAPGASFQTSINFAIPTTQAAGPIKAEATALWTDSAGNAYGPLEAFATTNVTNPTVFNSLVLAPASAGPNVTGTSQTLTATLKDPAEVPIANATVQFTVTGVNPKSATATTNAQGIATFTYTGTNPGADTLTATSGTAVSNTATVNWITPVQSISTSPMFARYFFTNGSGVFNTPPETTPAFIQAFPTINFNPPAGTVPGNTSGIGVNTRPFTNVTTDLNGNFTGTIIAQGNGLQAGVGSLFNFQAVYTGSLTVASAGDMVINFFSDDGFIFGVGNGATRVSGPLLNVPVGGVTPFEKLPVVGAFNAPTAPVANTIVVRFPAAGSYPYEVDYSECCAGQLVLTVAAGNVAGRGLPPTGSMKLSPLNLTAKPIGQTQTLTVEAFDASGLPAANSSVTLLISGPNTRHILGSTDSFGRATFSYSGSTAGTDTAQAAGSVAGQGTFSNVVNVPWTPAPDGNGGGDPGQPGGNIGPIVTQGWLGAPTNGSVLQGRTSITVSGVSLISGILDYWPSSNPAEIKVLNGNVVGSGTIATIDATLLANGEYTIRLRGTLSNGTQQTSIITINVTGDIKPGRVVKTVTDLRLPLAGMPLTISRRYDSLERDKVSDFGHGWTLMTSVRLDVNDKHDVTFTLNGRRQTFKFTPQSGPFPFTFLLFPKWVPEPGTFGTLISDGCGALMLLQGTYSCFLQVIGSFQPTIYQYKDPYGREYTMGADGQMKSIKDLNGNTLTFTPNGIFSSAAGVNVPFVRDAQGRITRITDPAGNEFVYDYDTAGDLVAVHLPKHVEPVRYEYIAHLLVKEIDLRGASGSATYFPDGRLESVTDREGHTVRYAYNLTANTISYTFEDGGVGVITMNSFGKVISVRDQLNRTTTYTYDDKQNLRTRTNALGKIWKFDYDANGNVTEVRDPLDNTTRGFWDERGRLLSVTDALNQVKTFEYDAASNVTALKDTIGQLIGATYDAKGKQTSLTGADGRTAQFGHDTFGNMTSVVDQAGFPSNYTYDATGQPTGMSDTRHGQITLTYNDFRLPTLRRDAEGVELKYSYDSNGNRITETDANGNPFTHEYDHEDRLVKTILPGGAMVQTAYDFAGRVQTRTDESGIVQKFNYNKAGEVTSVVKGVGTPLAATTEFRYDPAGRLVNVIDPRLNSIVLTYDDGDRLKIVRDAAGRATVFTYDANGQTRFIQRADNVTREIRYDVRGRPITLVKPDTTMIELGYDGKNLRTVKNEAGKITSYTYDKHGMIETVTDPAGNITRYLRDEVGNLISVRDAKLRETRFEWNTLDRLVKKVLPDGSFEQYTYDPVGHPIAVRLPDGNINRMFWDGLDRLVRTEYFDGKVVSFTYTPTGKRETATTSSGVTRYVYDAMDRLKSITQPNSVTVSYEYDAANNITAITTPRGVTRYTYDALNRVQTVTGPTGGPTTYTYDLGGRLTKRQLPNGVITVYDYDSQDRLRSMSHQLGAAAAFESFVYTLSPDGLRQSVLEADGRRTNWTYDDADRLLRETVVDPAGATISDLEYAYDAVGNRKSMTASGITTLFDYNALDQLTSAASPLGSAQYGYDNRGNLVSINDNIDGFRTSTFGYDAANRVVSASNSNGVSMGYTYDADGRLVREEGSAAVRNYAWNEQSQYGDIVYESLGTGTTVNYSYGAYGELVQLFAGTASYSLQDGLGSITGLTNAAGAQTDRYRYDAWGNRTSTSGPTFNPFGYRGQLHNDDLSLIYLRARYFHPGIGRFLTRDTAAFKLVDPVDLNRYLYAGANPINGYDPSGYEMVEYGIVASSKTEEAMARGYVINRMVESYMMCSIMEMLAGTVNLVFDAMIALGGWNPLKPGQQVWPGRIDFFTIAFGWALLAPIDAVAGGVPDRFIDPTNDAGRKVLLFKSGIFKTALRDLGWAMNGGEVDDLFELLTDIAQFIRGVEGRFIGDEANGADKCENHAERKIVRYYGAPFKNAVLAVGASRPICLRCEATLLETVWLYGGCFLPWGTRNQCIPDVLK